MVMNEAEAVERLQKIGVKENLGIIIDFLHNIDNTGFDH